MARHHFVKVTRTAYPLAPSSGYASERTVSVYAPLGYATDLIARIETDGTRGIDQARAFAAVLSGVAVDEIEVQTMYLYRDARNAITEQIVNDTEAHTRYARVCEITRAEFDGLLWPNLDPDKHTAAVAAVRTTIDAGQRQSTALAHEIAERLYGDDSEYGRALRGAD
jgi:hypothetical protein